MPATVTTADIFDALALLRPYDIDIPKFRCGASNDGGYILANATLPSQPVLSFGVGANCDLEYEFAERGHKVVMFDPTVEGPPKQHENFTFHKIGLGRKDDPEAGYVSLATALDMAGLRGRDDIILKMDIEGAEYDAFDGADHGILAHFQQIALEMHWLNKLVDPAFRRQFVDVLNKVNALFALFHVHANNCAPLLVIGEAEFLNQHHIVGGAIVADALELSYIRSSKVAARSSRTVYPTVLDRPNYCLAPDHLLTFFPFLPCDDDTFEKIKLVARLNDLQYVRT
ncbi:MAG: FkbM family methyltransferase [Methylocystis sp.]|nr:FkbM family methyltransferase [Methylocystis sp.]